MDLLQTRAGVEGAPQVFQRWALTTKQRAQLGPRAKARSAYAAVDRGDGAWLPPEGLRDAMTVWDFDRAAAVREKVAGLGAAATAVQDAAQQAGIAVPAPVREAYEKANSESEYSALATSLPKAAAAVTAVGDARQVARQDRDPVSALGATLLGVDQGAADAAALLDEGRSAEATRSAQDVTGRSDRALLVGLVLPVLLLLLLAGAVLGTRRALADRARHRAEREPVLPDRSGVAGEPVTASDDLR
jgi:hypothetical protein